MTSFGYRLNPRYAIKECLSCGALYTGDFCCSKGNVEDKILVPKPPKNCARCAKCGHPVNGAYCQGCSILREKLKEDLVTYLKYFQDTYESSDDSTNVVNAPREPVVVKKDHDVNLPQIDECCCECSNALDGIFCQQCTCKSCGKVPCVSKPNFVDESSKIFNPPPQPPIYYCEFCGSNAQYGHYCIPQASFINLEPGYTQDFNFPQDIHDFQQQGYTRVVRQLLNDVQSIHEELAEYINTPGWNLPAFYDDDDDDDVDYTISITPVLSTEEPVDSISMRDEHLDTIPTTESDEVIKSSVEDLIPIPNESEGIPEHMCDVPFHDNSPPLDVSKDQIEDLSYSNEEFSSINDDSFSNDNIDYVEASPLDSKLVSSEVIEIVIPEVGKIEDDHSPLFAYVVWIFIAYLTYPVIPPYLHSFGNEDTIFDPGITINHFYSFKPGLSHRCGAFKKFNTH
nr:hypothetical protein [Tanacetum cinerariifolium]